MAAIDISLHLTDSELEAITMHYGPWNEDVPESLHEKKALVLLKRTIRLEARRTIEAVVAGGVRLIEAGGWE